MVLRDDSLRLLQRRRPPSDLQIFIAGDAFDDSAFFDEQLEFAGLIGIAIQIGGEIDAPRGAQSRFTTPLGSWLLPLPKPVIAVSSGLAISHPFSIREAEWRHLDRPAGQKKGPGDGETWPKATAHSGIIGGRGVDDIWSGF